MHLGHLFRAHADGACRCGLHALHGYRGVFLGGIHERDLDLAEGHPVAISQGRSLNPAAIQQHAIAALQILDLVPAAGLADHTMVTGDAWVRQAKGVVQLPSYVDFVVHYLKFSNPYTFVHQKFSHDALKKALV